jgi:hypothetical protein
MSFESAVALGVSVITVGFVFLVLPLGITLANLPAIWTENRSNGVLLACLVAITGVLFIFYIVGILLIFASGS